MFGDHAVVVVVRLRKERVQRLLMAPFGSGLKVGVAELIMVRDTAP